MLECAVHWVQSHHCWAPFAFLSAKMAPISCVEFAAFGFLVRRIRAITWNYLGICVDSKSILEVLGVLSGLSCRAQAPQSTHVDFFLILLRYFQCKRVGNVLVILSEWCTLIRSLAVGSSPGCLLISANSTGLYAGNLILIVKYLWWKFPTLRRVRSLAIVFYRLRCHYWAVGNWNWQVDCLPSFFISSLVLYA